MGRSSLARRSCVSFALCALLVHATGCGAEGDPAAGADAATAEVDVALEDAAPPADLPQVADTGPACAEGAPCDDGDPCTSGERCDSAGGCVGGGAVSCDDGLACTVDSCARDAGGCQHALAAGFCLGGGEPELCVAHNAPDPTASCRLCTATGAGGPSWISLAEGAPCNDNDACTLGDRCELGVCVSSTARDCAVLGPCLSGRCDAALGCVTEAVAGSCDDGDPCTVGDSCDDGLCRPGEGLLPCDDGDPCSLDACSPGVGCTHDFEAVCDDGKPCTADTCLAGGACTNAPFVGPCEDGNPCTLGEQCDAAGICAGGADQDCDDANACTLDSCHPILGCLHLFVTGGCDDGLSCTVDDRCVAGTCFGAKTAACGLCPVTPTDHANKIVTLELMTDGNPGSGLDVDHDPSTCAPASSCGGGVDNALGVVGFLLNPSVAESITSGVVKWVVDLDALTFDGQPFALHVYDSALDPTSALPGCDFQAESCGYDVAQLSFDALCRANFSFDNAQIVDGVLVAGGDESLISMVLPLQGGSLLSMTIAWARVRAAYTAIDGKVTSLNAVIGGAIPKAQLVAAITGLDPAALPIDKEVALELLDTLVPPDIDLDGDGLAESISLGLRIATIPATITQ